MIKNTVSNFATIAAAIIFAFGINSAHAGVVTSSLDDGSLGSLREIIANGAIGETITFDPSLKGKTITLTNGQLVLAKNVQIVGPGASLLKISGNNASRVFWVNTGVTATISGLTIANGNPLGATGPTRPISRVRYATLAVPMTSISHRKLVLTTAPGSA